MRGVLFAMFIVGVLVAFFSHAAMAMLSQQECRRYADEAMTAAKFNAAHCGFRGGRWRGLYPADWQPHYDWCMGQTNSDVVMREWQLRNQQIADCRNADKDCVAYANTAISQDWTNRNQCSVPCHYGRWHSDRAAHEGWCIRVSPEQRRYEVEARARGMCECR
jgi:hypothetical protein